ncbi:MAG: response regulator [Verrucomicrobiota bacterium]
MKLLIVDDSMVIRRLIERNLNPTQFSEIETAGNGKVALEKFTASKPELVTMDITMPEMDGLDCIEKILSIAPQTKILVISGLADKSTAVEAIKRGAEGFLLKPITQESLAEAFTDLLED